MKDKYSELQPGLSASTSVIVSIEHTAQHLGSGHRLVLATPALVAQMEATAQKAVDSLLTVNLQTVGTHIDIRHDAATPIGMQVTVHATLLAVSGRILQFEIEARDEIEMIAKAVHERTVATTISLDRLLQKKLKNS